jgi:hypothetical protein
MPRSGQYGDVAARYRTADGWSVEVVRLSGTPDRHDGESFRVSHHGFWVGYARSLAELEKWVDVTDLEEALGRRARSSLGLHRVRTPSARPGAIVVAMAAEGQAPEPPFRGLGTGRQQGAGTGAARSRAPASGA